MNAATVLLLVLASVPGNARTGSNNEVPGPTPAAGCLSPAAQVTLTDIPTADFYAIHGTFESPYPPQAVWGVLSDYQGLGGVVNGLLSSRVLQRKGSAVLVEQVMEGRFLIFGRTFRLRLNVREQAPTRMEFSEAAPGPFRSYRGSWRIAPSPTGSTVDYTLQVSRGDMAPRFLERSLFQKNAADLLRDLSREVQRRAGLAKAATARAPSTPPQAPEALGKVVPPGTAD
ncbi:MAG TPA: SRPBCC family protein [bacterium]|jgi:hypothetical protein|nr:SRPBCC family protein [bacterium]